MSHVAVIDLQITNLEDLDVACKHLGLQLVRNKSDWRWFGSWMNDYSAEQAAFNYGIDPKEYGRCAEHVITIPGNNKCYEIGLVRRRDGKPGWYLVYDFFSGGYGMTEKVGDEKATLLQQYYAAAGSARMMTAKGFNAKIVKKENGHVQCICHEKKRQIR